MIYTFALGTTPANALMSQIHNKKMRMPTVLNDDLAYEWLMADIDKERVQRIARTPVSSNEMEYRTITKEYLSERVANPTTYDALPQIDMAYLDTSEELIYPAA